MTRQVCTGDGEGQQVIWWSTPEMGAAQGRQEWTCVDGEEFGRRCQRLVSAVEGEQDESEESRALELCCALRFVEVRFRLGHSRWNGKRIASLERD